MALKATRPSKTDLIKGLMRSHGYVYFPIDQMNYFDPDAPLTPRRLIIASTKPLSYSGLESVNLR
jgi:hypothetical protein